MADPKSPLEYTRESQERALDALKQTQDAVVDAMDKWSKSIADATPEMPSIPVPKGTPAVEEMVENSFDFAGEILSAQRDFMQRLLDVAQPAIKTRETEDVSA